MVREKEIEQAANGYLDSLFSGEKHQDLYVRLFMAGAQWADNNPTTPSVRTIIEILRINSNIHDRSNPHWIAEQIFKQLNEKNNYDKI